MTDSARLLQRFEDTMAKYFGELDRILYAAEIAGPTTDRGSICHHREGVCPFKSKFTPGLDVCKLRSLRVQIGEHVKQDDVMEEWK